MPAFLLLDVGNTRVKWAVAKAGRPLRIAGHEATAKITPHRLAALVRKFSRHCIVVASVVPKITRELQRVSPGVIVVHGKLPNLPLTFAYPRPAELGADRIAAAIAGKSLAPAIIVNCGTATAFSVLDEHGRFRGGAIAAGLEAQLNSLLAATAQLPETSLRPVTRALARSTRAAIRAGVMLNFQGGVREILARLQRELGRPAAILITGGNARYLQGVIEAKFRPLLVFEGLHIIATSLVKE